MENKFNNFNYKLYHETCIEKAILEIENNIADDLTIEHLAEISGYSPFHFQRLFKKYIDDSVAHYIIKRRLEKAAFVLKYLKLGIRDTAIKVGFNSNSSFTRSFKKYYKVSPLEFKNNFKELDPFIDKIKLPENEIVHLDNIEVYFLRNKNKNNKNIFRSWYDCLIKFIDFDFSELKLISLIYTDPSTSLNKRTMYEICIENKSKHKELPIKTIKGGRYAKFYFKGDLKNFYTFINIIYTRYFYAKRYYISLKPHFIVHKNSIEEIMQNKLNLELYIALE